MSSVNFVLLNNIEKSGGIENGRQKYTAGENIPGSKVMHTISVAQTDCDKFEKLFDQKQDIEKNTLGKNFNAEKFGTQTNEKVSKQVKIWSVIGSIAGGGIPFWLCSKIKGAKKYFIGAPLVLAGAAIGATAAGIGSMLVAMNTQLNKIPGWKDYISTQKQLSKLDVKEISVNKNN